jgi:predicted kinase
MYRCFVLVGLPASGKSTFLENLKDDQEVSFVYSTDAYIDHQAEALGKTYDDVFSDYIKKATNRMNQLLAIALKEGLDVYWDQTNLGAGKRRKIINQMKSAGYDVQCVYFIPPETEEENRQWKMRLTNRPGKTIPDHIIRSMKDNHVSPHPEEGFSRVMFYDMFGNFIYSHSEY